MSNGVRKKGSRRFLVWATAAVLVLAVFVVALMPKPVPVDVARIARANLRVTLDHEGKTRVRKRYVVSAPVAGRVLRIDLQPGDAVAANRTVLATLLPGAPTLLDARTRAEARSRLKAAEAALDQARAQRDQARAQRDHAATERDRSRNLFAVGLVTAEARQTAETEALTREHALEAADAAVVAASNEVDAVRATLLEPAPAPASPSDPSGDRPVVSLRSPIDGVVLSRLHESEAVVPQGEPLVEVADTSSLEVIADFLSTDAVQMKPGMPAIIDQWGGAAPVEAIVQRVEPVGFMKVSALGVEEQRVWVVIEFNDPRAAWRAMGDGYRVEARVVVWEGSNVVVAPTSSLFRHGADWAVFVNEAGVARLRTVTVGHRNGTSAEILSGLSPGDEVVVYPPDSVTDGTRVSRRAS